MGFLLLDFGLPEAVEIAVFVYCYGLFVGEGELCYGSFAGLQLLVLGALSGLKADPLYAVLFQHGVCYGANFYLYFLAQYGYYGEVLFLAGFNGVGYQLFHLFAAAYEGYAGVLDDGYDVAAVLADIKLSISHVDFSFKLFYFFYSPVSRRGCFLFVGTIIAH